LRKPVKFEYELDLFETLSMCMAKFEWNLRDLTFWNTWGVRDKFLVKKKYTSSTNVEGFSQNFKKRKNAIIGVGTTTWNLENK
jgi:hypothetical protein